MKFLRRSTTNSPSTRQPSPPDVPLFLFDGLRTPDVFTIYNLCQIRKFQPHQEVCSGHGDLSYLFMVTDGCVQFDFCLDDDASSIEYPQGSIFGFIAFQDIKFEKYALTTTCKTTVLEISRNAFETLPDCIKLFFYRKSNEYHRGYCLNLTAQNRALKIDKCKAYARINSMYTKTQTASSSEFVEMIIQKIPKLPTYAYELTAKLHDDHSQIQDVVESIHQDPALASFILKTVNSSFYGLPQKIHDVYRAVIFLGFNNVYQLVMDQAIRDFLPKSKDFTSVQTYSTVISTFSYNIAFMSNKAKPLTCSTIGLLHRIGSIVTLLLKRKYPPMAELFELLDDAQIGAKLLEAWGLPDALYRVIALREQPIFMPPEEIPAAYQNELAVLYLARVCGDLVLAQEFTSDMFLKDYMAVLGLPPQPIDAFYQGSLLPLLLKEPKKLPPVVSQILQQQSRHEPLSLEASSEVV